MRRGTARLNRTSAATAGFPHFMWKLHTFNVVKLGICVNFCGGMGASTGWKCKVLPEKCPLLLKMRDGRGENLRANRVLQELHSFTAHKYEFFCSGGALSAGVGDACREIDSML